MLLSPIGSPTKTLAQLSLPPCPEITELRLPVELILHIVEQAAVSSRKCALSLCLVSSWIRDTVVPALYFTVVLQGVMPSPFTVCHANSLRPRFLKNPVQFINNLWIDIAEKDGWPSDLEDCPHLTHLAMHLECHEGLIQPDIDFDFEWRPTVPKAFQFTNTDFVSSCRSFTVLGQSHPKRWSPFTQSPRGLRFLRGLTHLRLLNLCLSSYIPLEYTSNLTHLCIPFFDLRTNNDVLDFAPLAGYLQYPNLKMIVLTFNPRYWRFQENTLKKWARQAMEKDERLYVVASIRVDATRDWEDARKDWENEARGKEGIWDKAYNIRQKFISRSWE